MRILSVKTATFLVLLAGAILGGVPCVADTLNGGVSETDTIQQQQVQQPQQQMQPQMQQPTPYYGNAQQQMSQPLQATAQYDEQGHRIVGVLGAKVDMVHGTVLAVFPPSSLNQWGIHPGDVVLGYDYHPWKNGWDMEKAINAGPPGAVMQITILHDNRMLNIMAPRVDSRALVGYDRFLGNHYFQKRANQSQY